MEFGEIKEKVMSDNMTYNELVRVHDKFMKKVDSMFHGPDRYDREIELREIEDMMLYLRYG